MKLEIVYPIFGLLGLLVILGLCFAFAPIRLLLLIVFLASLGGIK